MSTRIQFDHWGLRGSVKIPAYAMRQPEETNVDAVARSIARKSGLDIASRPTPQGTECDENGRPRANQFELTFGRPVPRRHGGGMSVEGSVWVSIPIASREAS